jgi:type V secretory pathway adhesin AidA
MPATAIATPILPATSRAPWRTILFATASVVALSVSPPASAQQECGAPVAGVATCAVDAVGPDYPDGILYDELGDFTLNFDDAVAVTPTTGIGVNAAATGGLLTVNAPNVAITTAGPAAHGMSATSEGGGATLDLGGSIDAPGAAAAGLIVNATGDVSITSAADISGGGLAGIVIGGANTSATLTNSGIIGSASDLAIIGTSAGEFTVTNSGTITGRVELDGVAADVDSAAVTFDNSGTLELRDLTEAEGVITEAVAVADFGDEGVFNNLAGGVVTLGDASAATAWDTTGALAPEIGDPAGFDITLAPIEQGQLTGLTEFNNAGAIDMQDGAAGDVIAITNGVDGAPGTTTYISEGGTLLLDTVLNEGGATASLSDVLILDATELGAGGPTLVSIQGIGATGVETIEDGILVVDVLNPELSASGVFELDGLVISGPWQYGLFQGGDSTAGGDPLDGNWYLRTDGLAPTTDAYRAYPSSMMRATRLSVGTLQQRVGNRWWHVPEQRTQRTVTDPAPPPQPQTREFTVFFDWDKYDIRPDAAATIQEAAEYARSGNAARIVVIGHTDTSGSAEYNMGLSERRANAVSQALQQHGVAAQVIGMEWFGETRPAVDTGDGVREQANRRTYVQVSVPGTPDPNAQGRTRVVEDVIPARTMIQGSGVWGRIVGTDAELERDDDLGRVDETAFMGQFGVDFAFGESEASRMIGSVSVHYIDSETDVATADFGDVATIESEGWGVSGGITWYSDSGAYVDGVLSGTWFEGDIGSDALGELASGNEGFAWAASIEGGMRYEGSPNYYWVPQGQLIYTSVDIDEFTDPFGAVVDEADSDSLVGRIGVAFEYLNTKPNDAGDMTNMQAYGIVNLLYEFLGAPGASASGIDLDEDIDDFWGEFGAGFTYGFNSQWAVYGEASYKTALENFGDSQAIQGSLGVRYNW